MATEQITNGSFAPHQQNYGGSEKEVITSQSSSGGSDIPKDEVGWYFVEQYYTTLSRSPEKLFLFYNKRSQYVSGTEEEKVQVCVGQKAINDRIKELDFQDCKVRITNVDSQGSDQHIVIQVIGEISNKQQPHKKFVQTFILAAQTNGYFVLNDIFRYIADEDAEVEGEDAPQAEDAGSIEPVPTDADAPAESLSTDSDAGARGATAQKLDEGLNQAIATDANVEPEVAAPPAPVNGTAVQETAEVEVAGDAPVAAVSSEEKPAEEAATAAVEEEVKQPEKPKNPEPTPVQPKAAPAAAPAPAKPAVPKSWASLAAAANRVAMPQMPGAASSSTAAAPKSAAASAPQAPTAATPPTAPAAPAPAQVQRDLSPATSGGDSAGWQTAGADHSKRQSRSINQPPPEEQSTRAYIKNVFEGIKDEELKAALQKHGDITYLDISRGKNCAFVDFATRASFEAAVAANPHKIGDESIFVEERRVRAPGNFPGNFPRGGAQRGGRGDARPAGQGRGGFKQEGGRGGFNPRGRGGTATPRGRGNSQAA